MREGIVRRIHCAAPTLSALQTKQSYFARVLAILIVISVFGCQRSQAPPACPAGTKLMGAAPPKGTELWCQKTIDGKSVKDGPFIVYATSGNKMIEGSYRDGVQEGEWTLWYENGARASLDHYQDGIRNGLHTSWYATGQKALEGDYRDGKREGVWTHWDPSGLRSQKTLYRNGQAIK